MSWRVVILASLAALVVAGCATYQAPHPLQPVRRSAPADGMLCDLDSLRWGTGFVPRVPGSLDCVAILDYVKFDQERAVVQIKRAP